MVSPEDFAVAVSNGRNALPEWALGGAVLKVLVGAIKGFLRGVFSTIFRRQQKAAQRENPGVALLVENFKSSAVCRVCPELFCNECCGELRVIRGVIKPCGENRAEAIIKQRTSELDHRFRRLIGNALLV